MVHLHFWNYKVSLEPKLRTLIGNDAFHRPILSDFYFFPFCSLNFFLFFGCICSPFFTTFLHFSNFPSPWPKLQGEFGTQTHYTYQKRYIPSTYPLRFLFLPFFSLTFFWFFGCICSPFFTTFLRTIPTIDPQGHIHQMAWLIVLLLKP